MKRQVWVDAGALAERVLRMSLSKDAAMAVVGDLLEDVERRRATARPLPFPRAWLIGQALLHVAHTRTGGRLDIPAQRRQRVTSVLIYELRHALRMIRKRPGIAAAAVLSLAVGIGASTAIFSVVNAALLRELPVPDPEALVQFSGWQRGNSAVLSYPMVQDIGERQRVLAGICATGYLRRLPAEGVGWREERLGVAPVTGNYFSLLGLSPQYGRLLTSLDDDRASTAAQAGAVLSHSFWMRRFGGDPNAIGQTLLIPPRAYSIIGVAPSTFTGDTPGSQTDVWVPLTALLTQDELQERGGSSINVMGRLRPGIRPEVAAVDLSGLYRDLLVTEAQASRWTALRKGTFIQDYRIDVRPASRGFDYLSQRFARPLQILLGVVLLLQVIASFNFASLLVARARSDQPATAIRSALGATRSRLLVRGLIESLTLAVLGILAGLLVAAFLGPVLLAVVQLNRDPIVLDITPDARVLGLGALLGLIAGFVFGFVPAWMSSQMTMNHAFSLHGVTAAHTHRLFRRSLVVGQIAISLVLAFATTLMVKTLTNLHSAPLGFDSRGVVIADAVLDRDPASRARSLARVVDLHERLNGLPTVEAASLSFVSAFSGRQMGVPLLIPGAVAGVQRVDAWHDDVSPEYFRVLRVPLLTGRTFQVSDGDTAPRVAVVNAAFARKYFGTRSPVGEVLTIDTPATKDTPASIVGVVADIRYTGARHEALPMVYFSIFQGRALVGAIEIRSVGDVAPLLAQVRQLARTIGGNFHILNAAVLGSHLEAAMATERTLTRLLTAFCAVALLLVSIGIYGLLSQTLTQLTPEIGVRMALGAGIGRVGALISKEAVWVVSVGLVVGLIGCRIASRLVSAFLFDVGPNDPAMLAISVCTLIGVGMVATAIPALRAMRIDPLTALRKD